MFIYMLQSYSGYGEVGWGGGGRWTCGWGFAGLWFNQEVLVQGLLGSLCCVFRQDTLFSRTVPHSIQVYKWVPSYLMFGVILFLKGGIQKLVYASA